VAIEKKADFGATIRARAKFSLPIDRTSGERKVIKELDDKVLTTVGCGLCDWSFTGPAAEALVEQAGHREKHRAS
jgi:hypothetical protein